MLDDFRLRVFVKVAEKGGFTLAAKELGISQPAVSQNVAELERELGVELLTRSRGAASLTSAGKVFHEYALKILWWYDSAGRLFDDKPASSVKIACGPEVQDLLGNLMCRLIVAFPGSVFKLVDENEEGADMALRLLPCNGMISFDGGERAFHVSPAAVSAKPACSGISGLEMLPDTVRFAVWSPYFDMLNPGLKARTALVGKSASMLAEAASECPDLVAIIPDISASRSLARIPVDLSGLGMDLALIPSESFARHPVCRSILGICESLDTD